MCVTLDLSAGSHSLLRYSGPIKKRRRRNQAQVLVWAHRITDQNWIPFWLVLDLVLNLVLNLNVVLDLVLDLVLHQNSCFLFSASGDCSPAASLSLF